MSPKQRLVTFIVSLLVILACTLPAEDPKVFSAPLYATNESIAQKVVKDGGFKDYNLYYAVPESEIKNQVVLGLIAVLIAPSDLYFSKSNISDYGQTCKIDGSEWFSVSDYNLIVQVTTTTTNPSFFEYCKSQLPESVVAVLIEAKGGDGDVKISYRYVLMPLKVNLR